MHDKRHSIFISSTFEDLKDERRAVQDVVISAGDFPVQMESFPAADEDQFEFIKALIDKCDYYVLIVAGRYGTPADDGMSYTEKEYRYAVSKGIPVLVMLHGDRGNIPVNKSEDSPDGKARLTNFVKAVQTSRLRKDWVTTDGLKLAVREALDNAKATKPAIGWIRGDAIASFDALEELAEVRKENAKYRDAIGNLTVELALPPIPAGDEHIVIDLLPTSIKRHGSSISGSSASLRCTWIGAFPIFFSGLKWQTNDWNGEINYYLNEDQSCDSIGAAFAAELASFDCERLFRISKATFDRFSSYYIEAGLMVSEGERPFTEAAQRYARRHRINGGESARPIIVKGSIERTFSPEDNFGKDDEVPF
jgi:Domain of unknown function (DUF4062)